MKTQLLVLLLCFCATQFFFAQEDDGVVALSIPIRNSLTFNRYIINPTFSFVREQHKYISLYNKREWVQFDDAPLTYLASYSGRLGENMGAGFGLFQQNYGVLTTFGGVLNFAYNARISRENNLTFGLNIGAYKSGLNQTNVVTNYDDPSLQNVPENFILTVNPGINFGLEFFDFGVSINNLVAYNFNSSKLIEENPERGIQGHIMYTGYMNSSGFFDQAKFSGLVKSEFKKDETIVSATTMLTVPKGIWAQVGYNSTYGVSGGIGLNITTQIAIEYNFEKTIGDLTEFGPSHDVTLAYRFKNNKNYDYSRADEVVGLISLEKNRKPAKLKLSKAEVEAKRALAQERKAEAEAKKLADQQAKQVAAAEAKMLAEQKAESEAAAEMQRLAEQKAKEEVEQKAKVEAEAEAKRLAEQKAKEEAEAEVKRVAERKAKEAAEAQAQLLAEQKAKEEAEAQLLAEQKAEEAAQAEAQKLAEQKAASEAAAQAQRLADQKAAEEAAATPTDELAKAMLAIAQQAAESKEKQDELFDKIDDIVEIKNQDLIDLKEENDLSEQGISVELKPFKSISEENDRLLAMISQLDAAIVQRNQEIADLKSLYEAEYKVGTVYLDEIVINYKKTMDRLTAEQIEATQAKLRLQLRLDEIQVATAFERNRRIKRAAFDNEEARYQQDRETLQNIKANTQITGNALKVEDYDFGEEQTNNIQILKNIKNVENGYYLIIAVHNDIEKRNDFVTKVAASGRLDVDFFYDVKTSKYYIYYDKFESIEEANVGLNTKGNKPYNINMSIVKIED
ncbi:MAG: PorP/SprF family type IX secretion system membrane protein [Flavobacteriaceae bacterium]|nr:PorP/SprF family type IX secretion system membrane protein [Flavobacteriaceae bacterium]